MPVSGRIMSHISHSSILTDSKCPALFPNAARSLDDKASYIHVAAFSSVYLSIRAVKLHWFRQVPFIPFIALNL